VSAARFARLDRAALAESQRLDGEGRSGLLDDIALDDATKESTVVLLALGHLEIVKGLPSGA
jgi:hypothetical protein